MKSFPQRAEHPVPAELLLRCSLQLRDQLPLPVFSSTNPHRRLSFRLQGPAWMYEFLLSTGWANDQFPVLKFLLAGTSFSIPCGFEDLHAADWNNSFLQTNVNATSDLLRFENHTGVLSVPKLSSYLSARWIVM